MPKEQNGCQENRQAEVLVDRGGGVLACRTLIHVSGRCALLRVHPFGVTTASEAKRTI
jgi:hypothetical protein